MHKYNEFIFENTYDFITVKRSLPVDSKAKNEESRMNSTQFMQRRICKIGFFLIRFIFMQTLLNAYMQCFLVCCTFMIQLSLILGDYITGISDRHTYQGVTLVHFKRAYFSGDSFQIYPAFTFKKEFKMNYNDFNSMWFSIIYLVFTKVRNMLFQLTKNAVNNSFRYLTRSAQNTFCQMAT